ncbi:MAG: hypothetical protein LBG65_06025 [Puniceicoccales bacterium]|jgi:hypothetical protein|nr:hypothetical protein [Puniceicoccales bacterium]
MSKTDTNTRFLTPLPQIIRELPKDFADEILVSTQDKRGETFAALMSVTSIALKFRPNIWRTWPKARQREWLWTNLHQSRFADTARQLLQDWFFNNRAAMLNSFLDSLGIFHDSEGCIREDLPESLDDAKVRLGVDSLLGAYPPREVALYLRLFQYGHPLNSGWESIASCLGSDSRFAAE